MSALEWFSYRSADRLIGLAPGIVAGITRRGVPAARVSMIPNGCDLEVFAAPERAWRPPGVAEDDLMAVFAGTHGVANGLEAVLDAAGELERRGVKGIKLVFVGDGKRKESLMARAGSDGLDCCIFLPPVPKLDLAGLLGAADVGLMILDHVPAFYYGTSPNKFFDYLAAGIPVLVNYPGWVADLVRQNHCGVSVRPADPVAFADALETLAGDESRRHEMGVRARALGCREFARGLLSSRFIAVLESARATTSGAPSHG